MYFDDVSSLSHSMFGLTTIKAILIQREINLLRRTLTESALISKSHTTDLRLGLYNITNYKNNRKITYETM